MAQRIITTFIDDLDGREAKETVHFGVDGMEYEIDLHEENAQNLRETLAVWVTNARRLRGATAGQATPPKPRPQGPPAKQFSKVDRTAMRAWGPSNGYPVGHRGRIPTSLTDAWIAAGRPR